jgi:beta-glucosidase
VVLPEGFRWGATASSVSADGVAPAADWSTWERDGRVPRSGAGGGFTSDYADDLETAARIGLTDVRITVEWARLEPKPGRVDSGVVDHYREVLQAARESGLSPWVTLHHTSLPGWFAEDERGFRDASSRSRFWARHVDRTAEQFDDLAAGWAPIEDPVGWALRAFLLGTRPPGETNPERARDAVAGAVEATFDAWRLLGSGRQPVMAVLGLPSVVAVDAAARDEARLWESVLWDTWLRALGEGEFALPWRAPVERPDLQGLVDLVGVVADHPVGIDRHGGFHPYPADGRTDGSGFCPVPEELGVVLRRVHEALPDRDLVVAATGAATDDDDWRDELLTATVDQVELAVADGVPVTGLFHDSLVDGYEWTRGLDAPRGLFTRDRRLKFSGRHLSERITGHPPDATLG